MIRCRLVLAALALVVAGSGCGVGVDTAPRPLEPIFTGPLQPAPTVIERPDDRSALCLSESLPPSTIRPAPAPQGQPTTAAPTSGPPTTAPLTGAC